MGQLPMDAAFTVLLVGCSLRKSVAM